MKVIVTQSGARHGYAVPRMLHQRGNLERLYTGPSVNRGVGRWLHALAPGGFGNGRIAKLLERSAEGVPPNRIRSADRLLLDDLLPRKRNTPFGRRNRLFSDAMMQWGLGEADMVYSMFGEGGRFLRYAKEQGLKIAVDFYLNPVMHRIVREEREQFPDWEEHVPVDEAAIEHAANQLIALADLITCPSETVLEGLKTYPACEPSRIRMVPYGSPISFEDQANQPVRGRVLFVGGARLGKGIHYLARAARELDQQGAGCEFRVVGHVSERIRNRPECRALHFLGHLPRSRMADEYRSADVFVLPTLAEGSASVVYEALAAGVPVVTTRSAGSVVAHGKDGLIVPERDFAALAEGISAIVENRARRGEMSVEALRTSATFSEAAWSQRLHSALQDAFELPRRG